mgnify:CR=1|tara:strand:+ start:2758 stop:2946 length:189 start_codon:yes stop_codon:yes gene_type:complete
MGMGAKHYFPGSGKEFKGKYHKMDDGTLHTGATHSRNSKLIVHYGDLSKKAKEKARSGWRSS